MSVQAMAWVLDHSPRKSTDRLVLLSIANHAGPAPVDEDDDGHEISAAWEAWPGIATMQREAGLDRERTVTDALTRLVKAGALVRVLHGAPDQRIRADRRSNLYRVLLSDGVPCDVRSCPRCGVTRGDSDGVSPHDVRGVASRRSRGVAARQVNHQGNRVEQPSLEQPLFETAAEPPTSLADKQAQRADEFDQFYARYPRKAAPATARKAFDAARKRADFETIMAGVERYRIEQADTAKRFHAMPATWLNGDRWLDEPTSAKPPARGAAATLTRNNFTEGEIKL